MAKTKITTIKLDKSTKERLDHLKKHEKESYDESIVRLLNILNICKKSPSLASRILRDIDRSKNREMLIENPEKLMRKKQITTLPIQQMRSLQRPQVNPRPMPRREL